MTLRYRYIVMQFVTCQHRCTISTYRNSAISSAIANPAGGREYRIKLIHFSDLHTHAVKPKMSLT